MTLKTIIDSLIHGKYGELIRYLVFGVLNVIITWTIYAACVLSGIDPTTSNVISWVTGVTFAFVVNKLYVFYSKCLQTVVVGREATLFVIGRVITGAIALVGFPIVYNMGLNQSLFGVDGFYDKILMSAIETVLNYLFSKYLVFYKVNKANQ